MENVYDGIENAEYQAVENDWLDVTYTAKKYLAEEAAEVEEKSNKKRRAFKWNGNLFKKIFAPIALAAACIALCVGLILVDGNFQGNLFETARATVTSTVFSGFHEDEGGVIKLPVTVTIIDVKDGVITFGGGKAALSFTDGVVESVSDDGKTVVIAIDDTMKIVYGDLTQCFVSAGDVVSANQLIARYDVQATASILRGGETVQQVVGSESSLQWSV